MNGVLFIGAWDVADTAARLAVCSVSFTTGFAHNAAMLAVCSVAADGVHNAECLAVNSVSLVAPDNDAKKKMSNGSKIIMPL